MDVSKVTQYNLMFWKHCTRMTCYFKCQSCTFQIAEMMLKREKLKPGQSNTLGQLTIATNSTQIRSFP